MIRALATQKDGRKLLILGVDRTNIDKLTSKQPIIVRGDQFGLDLPVDFLIMFGETLDDVATELRQSGVGPIQNPLPDPVGKTRLD